MKEEGGKERRADREIKRKERGGEERGKGKKEEERIVEGESFLFALLSGQGIIPQITNANKSNTN